MQWMPIILLLMIAVAAAASPVYALSNPFSGLDDKLKDVVGGFFEWIINGIKGIFGSIVDAIKGIFQSFADGIKDFAKTVFSAITKPFTYLADAFRDSLAWFENHLGPLAPLGYVLILAGVALVIWLVIKYIVPGPIP